MALPIKCLGVATFRIALLCDHIEEVDGQHVAANSYGIGNAGIVGLEGCALCHNGHQAAQFADGGYRQAGELWNVGFQGLGDNLVET